MHALQHEMVRRLAFAWGVTKTRALERIVRQAWERETAGRPNPIDLAVPLATVLPPPECLEFVAEGRALASELLAATGTDKRTLGKVLRQHGCRQVNVRVGERTHRGWRGVRVRAGGSGAAGALDGPAGAPGEGGGWAGPPGGDAR